MEKRNIKLSYSKLMMLKRKFCLYRVVGSILSYPDAEKLYEDIVWKYAKMRLKSTRVGVKKEWDGFSIIFFAMDKNKSTAK